MFSCGGENVYPKEVENLLFAHPDVVNAVVAPVPHAVKGFRAGRHGGLRAQPRHHGGGSQSVFAWTRAGLFASALCRDGRRAAVNGGRQDRPRRGAGEAPEKVRAS